jgi:hypothetical protein
VQDEGAGALIRFDALDPRAGRGPRMRAQEEEASRVDKELGKIRQKFTNQKQKVSDYDRKKSAPFAPPEPSILI